MSERESQADYLLSTKPTSGRAHNPESMTEPKSRVRHLTD